ncbi:elongation factor P maturation arginine rhamnosyltransferase EarP [Caenimonas sp. SL110]|uniref:elongation factor P maturation arginine rhamnosyltransferase EarP n=1 Tax=Caenimonas sp. SL110 TaxID=1450524 RepID=UPI0009E1CCEB|nr:elongation factor P maturation arginine rhamnosyltransferase EarP [Caenimonas sp. SL110]
MLWDIFCKVIDNHGDIGVCWRLAAQLGALGESVRLWVDDASALVWMAPAGARGVEVRDWALCVNPATEPGDLVIESFGCEMEQEFQAAMARRAQRPAWINLEYLTAETFAERTHRLPSPVLAGPAAGMTKHFFYPGFTPGTGGLLREPDLEARQAQFNAQRWLGSIGVSLVENARRLSLFCYEPPQLKALLVQLATDAHPTQLLVTAGRASVAARAAIDVLNAQDPQWNAEGHLSIRWLPLLTQTDFDHLLWSCDLNFVRGEDSLVRALWAGKPFIWQIYPQDDDAHHAKLQAFLDWMDAPQRLRQFHLAWNDVEPALPRIDPQAWTPCAKAARNRLLDQQELVTQLLRFVDKLK